MALFLTLELMVYDQFITKIPLIQVRIKEGSELRLCFPH